MSELETGSKVTFLEHETWIGDRLYVLFQLLPLVCTVGMHLITRLNGEFMYSPRTAQSFLYQLPRQSYSTVLGIDAWVYCIVLPVYFCVLHGMWNRMKWAYIFELVFISSVFASNDLRICPIIFLFTLGRLLYVAMRLSGGADPPLR